MRQKLFELSLLSQCALADNRQAFGRLVEMHAPKVRRFLLNLTKGDVCLTDDLSQETFLKAYLAIRSFKGLSNFSTWLYRIAYNEYLAWRRRKGEEELAPDYDVADDDCTEDERIPDIMEEIDAMPDPMRSIIILFYLEDLPIKDISRILGINANTAKVYLKRGREKLRNKFAQ